MRGEDASPPSYMDDPKATDKQQQRGDNPWFQCTPPIRRATCLIPSFDVLYLFRSTPTMGRATGEWRIISHDHCFNPRPHAEGDT